MRQNDFLYNKLHRRGWLTAVLTAAVLVCSLAGCQADVDTVQTDTELTKQDSFQTTSQTESTESLSETSAPESGLTAIETLAEGEERDYKIEDILKNDLEIDGISISLPCTLNELLEALGEDYSVDECEIEDAFEGKTTTKSKYFNGEFLSIQLYYAGEKTYGFLRTITNSTSFSIDTINVIGHFGGIHNGIINLSDISAGDSLDKCLKNYGKPNEIIVGEKFTSLIYEDDDCFIQIDVKNNKNDTIDSISLVGFKTEDLKNE